MVKNLPTNAGGSGQSLGQEDPQRRKWQPTLVFLPGNPMDRGASQAKVHGITRVRHDLVTRQQQ